MFIKTHAMYIRQRFQLQLLNKGSIINSKHFFKCVEQNDVQGILLYWYSHILLSDQQNEVSFSHDQPEP
jgi:hypothetical protein